MYNKYHLIYSHLFEKIKENEDDYDDDVSTLTDKILNYINRYITNIND